MNPHQIIKIKKSFNYQDNSKLYFFTCNGCHRHSGTLLTCQLSTLIGSRFSVPANSIPVFVQLHRDVLGGRGRPDRLERWHVRLVADKLAAQSRGEERIRLRQHATRSLQHIVLRHPRIGAAIVPLLALLVLPNVHLVPEVQTHPGNALGRRRAVGGGIALLEAAVAFEGQRAELAGEVGVQPDLAAR